VQHAVATLPAPVVPSNSAPSFQSCINSTTNSSPSAASQFQQPDDSIASSADPSIYQQQQQPPDCYDYAGFPHAPAELAEDTKPGWDILGADVLSDLAGSATYPGTNYPSTAVSAAAAGTSHHMYQQPRAPPTPHQASPLHQASARAAGKRMTAPRSSDLSHMHGATAAWVCTS